MEGVSMAIEPAISAEEWAERRLARDDYRGEEPNGDDDAIPRGENQFAEWNEYGLTTGDADWTPANLPTLIAAANAVLPDSDPRKITREWVTFLRDAALPSNEAAPDGGRCLRCGRTIYGRNFCDEHRRAVAATIADALESYLPPDPSVS